MTITGEFITIILGIITLVGILESESGSVKIVMQTRLIGDKKSESQA